MASEKENILQDERHVLQDDTETGVDLKIQVCHGQNESVHTANKVGVSLYAEMFLLSLRTNRTDPSSCGNVNEFF